MWLEFFLVQTSTTAGTQHIFHPYSLVQERIRHQQDIKRGKGLNSQDEGMKASGTVNNFKTLII